VPAGAPGECTSLRERLACGMAEVY